MKKVSKTLSLEDVVADFGFKTRNTSRTFHYEYFLAVVRNGAVRNQNTPNIFSSIQLFLS